MTGGLVAFLRALPGRFRRRPAQRRPDRLAIAVMEYEELGIEPEPGTAAALVIGLRALSRAGISINRTDQQ